MLNAIKDIITIVRQKEFSPLSILFGDIYTKKNPDVLLMRNFGEGRGKEELYMGEIRQNFLINYKGKVRL